MEYINLENNYLKSWQIGAEKDEKKLLELGFKKYEGNPKAKDINSKYLKCYFLQTGDLVLNAEKKAKIDSNISNQKEVYDFASKLKAIFYDEEAKKACIVTKNKPKHDDYLQFGKNYIEYIKMK